MQATSFHWIVFSVLVSGLLAADLLYSKRKPHAIGMLEATLMSIGWIAVALFFNLWIYFELGKEAGITFLTGYLLEKSLSVDNLFVFLIIFSYFNLPSHLKHTVLFYGIIGAIIMRALLIWAGITLISHFQWIFYLFGIFLIITGIRLAIKKEEDEVKLEESYLYKIVSSLIPLTNEYHGTSFLVNKGGKWIGTPLLMIVLLIEATDLVFAIDSVPAILGITSDPFIVFTSNIFAILGLRSLFFVLEGSMERFYLLHYALAIILIFIGCKMLLIQWIHIPTYLTLGILVSILGIAITASSFFPQKNK